MSSRLVLIVEDNRDNREIVRTFLEHVGYRVLEAEDGEAGVRVANEERPDIILMDMSLPLLDGWEATRRLKGDPETAAIPIVAMTAHAMTEHEARAALVGCDAYLAKPVEPRRVLETVEKVLGEAPASK